MLNTFKLRHHPLTTKWSRYRQVLVLFGRQGCGIGQAGAMCGALVCGLVHQRATALGTTVAGTTLQAVAGITVAVTGVELNALITKGNFFGKLSFLSDTIR